MKNENLVDVKDLITSFTIEKRTLNAVDRVNFTLRKGRTLGVVGESGCGKSVTALSIMRLVPSPPGKIARGSIFFQEKDLLKLSEKEMLKIRGNDISMIFQEPMSALNPVYRVGDQVSEVFVQHQGLNEKEALEKSIEMLKKVSIPSPEKRVAEYPHQLSGGMIQRVMIAIALSCKPKLLIADEPTTALDVTIQAQILMLMKELQSQYGMSILFITHDLGVVAEMCDDALVMYTGKVVERASVKDLFNNPQHPYTHGLMNSKITLELKKGIELNTIEGIVPSLFALPKGCSFQDRCGKVTDHCRQEIPELKKIADEHWVACHET